tara:strand:- start:123 stop:1463 length:1341 start_codon:yes stop_codon:yes gene_type:complete
MNLLRKIFPPLCLMISFMLLIYTFFRSEIYWDGYNPSTNSKNYYIVYYIASTLLIIFSIITFFLNKKIKDYLIITLISCITGIYISEGYLTFKRYDLTFQKQLYEKETGKKYDTRTPIEIYEDLKKIDNNITVQHGYTRRMFNNYNVPQKITFFSGISNSKTIMCNENGYYSIIQSDRYGFNNPDYEWDNKEVEYLLIGDSFVSGNCVNRPNDIASVLRTLSNKSAISLGYGGNGPLIEFATLREYLNSNVKKVIWFYYENDLLELSKELDDKILTSYLNDLTYSQNLKSKQNEIDLLAETKIEKNRAKKIKENSFVFKVFEFIKIYNLRSFLTIKEQVNAKIPVDQKEFKKILELAKDLTTKNNSKLYFVYLPPYALYKTEYDNSKHFLVKKIINELNIPFIDIHTELFKKEKNPLKFFSFELNNHFNIEGYKKVSEIIYKLTKD